MRDIFHLSVLIIKKKLKILKDDERHLLKSIRAEHSITKKTDFINIVKKISDYSLINKEKAWNSILEKRAQNIVPLYQSKKQSWYKYAAAASLVLLFSVTYFVWNEKAFKSQDKIVINKDIEIGRDKATLTLEDGSVVGLEKGTAYSNSNASSNGEKIIYKSGQKATSQVFNVLTIPTGGQFNIQLADGTKVWLNSESQLKFPVAFTDGETREVQLIYGEAYFQVSHSTEHKGSHFKVLSKGQNIEVLGTEFNLKAYQDEESIFTTLVNGKVRLSSPNAGSTFLKPGQQSVLDKEGNEFIIKNVEVFNEVSWKEGIFSFNAMPLKDIMKVLARWYDVKVVFRDPKNELVRINGILDKDQKIEEILNIISKTNKIPYEIKEKTIIFK
ncbi:FecR family protein [Flavobacterium phragmitis]|uniref:FecR family protein n=1 Tax=Flavobacterium phragmitis TaxID=739143 RepID=A0A1I1X0A4_9FLAO|nr:FecR domain-containing protein [Flavobacterium phragmitis]SFD99113.1 FecR family protein [Flavobacterium phragmitis]